MGTDSIAQLAEFARRELGESLRAVVVVDDDGFEVLYIREDLQQAYTEATFGTVVNTFRDLPDPPFDGQSPLGDRQAVVHYYEHAFVFQFEVDEHHSVLMGIDTDVGTKLRTFIDSARDRV